MSDHDQIIYPNNAGTEINIGQDFGKFFEIMLLCLLLSSERANGASAKSLL